MRTLYVHVGVHRTATTTIQRFMRANFAALLDKGYLYPFGTARHNAVVRQLRYGVLEFDDFAGDLNRRMQAKSAHSAILSDEDISMIVDIGGFAALTRHFVVKVVVSLRRQDLWLESWYLQNVKWQWDPSLAHISFAEFFERRGEFFWIDYAARLAEYEAAFGAGSVIACVFEPQDMPGGPIAAFLDMVGITDRSGFGPLMHKNASLSARTSEFLRHLPLDEMPDKDRRLFERAAVAMDGQVAGNGSNLIMTPEQRGVVMTEHRAGNAAVAQQYFKRDDLFRVALPAVDAPLADVTLPAMSADFMQEFLVPYIRALGVQVQDERMAGAADQPKNTLVRARI